jgi:hypothetical protein
MGKRDLTGVAVGLPAARGQSLTTKGVALSARARTIRDWSMVWLRDYARPALSMQHTCCDAFRVVRQRWAQCEHVELYELRLAAHGARTYTARIREPARSHRRRREEEQAQREAPGNGQVS